MTTEFSPYADGDECLACDAPVARGVQHCGTCAATIRAGKCPQLGCTRFLRSKDEKRNGTCRVCFGKRYAAAMTVPLDGFE